jgi:two-component system, sensor histidine kinase and response regulator
MSDKVTVLAIDDDPVDGELIKRHLENIDEWEINYHFHSDSSEGLITLVDLDPDLLLLDLNMGVRSGLDVMDRARETGYTKPIIIVTDNEEAEVAVDSLRKGATDFICKRSLTSQSLKRIIGNALEKNLLREALNTKHNELLTRNNELKKSNAEISRFYQILAHELRTPLTSALEFISITLEGLAGPVNLEQGKLLLLAQDSCEQISRLINDLFDTTRLETGKLGIETCRVDPSDLLERIVESLEPSARKIGIDLRLEITGTLPDLALDEQRIRQVINNLAHNAINVSQEGDKVIVGAHCSEGSRGPVTFWVKDEGCGIPLDEQDKLFDRLYQVRQDEGVTNKGTGLGLHLCRELVQLHEGEIWVESEVGKGSIFTFTIPVMDQTAESDQPTPEEVLV